MYACVYMCANIDGLPVIDCALYSAARGFTPGQ